MLLLLSKQLLQGLKSMVTPKIESLEDRYWHNIKGKYVGSPRVGYYLMPKFVPSSHFHENMRPSQMSRSVFAHSMTDLYRFLAKWLNWHTFRGGFWSSCEERPVIACNFLIEWPSSNFKLKYRGLLTFTCTVIYVFAVSMTILTWLFCLYEAWLGRT